MSVCPLDQNNYCPRHNRRHIGVTREIALDPGPRGEYYRLEWDRYMIAPAPQRRQTAGSRRETVRRCAYMGEQVFDNAGDPVMVWSAETGGG